MTDTAVKYLSTFLAKAAAGAGSRGGHVIGTTRSGRPIYASGHEKYKGIHNIMSADDEEGEGHRSLAQLKGRNKTIMGKNFDHFTTQEHEDAAKAHFKHAEGLEMTNYRAYEKAASVANAHADRAREGRHHF